MSKNIYQRLAAGGSISEEKKEGILWGMELMGLQTEKWFDNKEHANAYRTDTLEGCGFSGWKETVGFTRCFLESEEPESDENEGVSMIVEDGSETSDMELTDDETDEEEDWNDEEDGSDEDLDDEEDGSDEDLDDEEDGSDEDLDDEEDGSDEDRDEEDGSDEDLDDEEDGSDEDRDGEGGGDEGEDDEDGDWNQWDNFTYEGVPYMVGPGENNSKVVLDVDNYHQVGIIVDMELGEPVITFEDNATYENHMEKVRQTTVPRDGKEAVQFLLKFIQNNYPKLNLCPEGDRNPFCNSFPFERNSWRSFPFESIRGPMFVLENNKDENGKDFGLMTPHPKGWRETVATNGIGGVLNFHLWKTFADGCGSTNHYYYTKSQRDCPSDLSYDPRGKKMGEVMKVIEKAL